MNERDSGCDRGTEPAYLTIGTITSPKGLAGEVRVHPHTDWPERFNALARVFLGAGGRPTSGAVTVERVTVSGPSIVIKLAGSGTREQAKALHGRDLLIPVEEAWPLPEGHYYHYQLLGMNVRDLDGRDRGTLVRIYPGPANDFLAVSAHGGGEVLIPAVRAAVREIDLQHRVVVVKWPEYYGDEKESSPGGGC